MTKKLPCRVCGEPIEVPAKYAGMSKSAVHPECMGNEPKAEADTNTIQKLLWGVVDWLLRFIRANGNLLLAGSAGFGAAWGFFEYGTIGWMIAGAFSFPCLLCGLLIIPLWIWLTASSLWNGLKRLLRGSD